MRKPYYELLLCFGCAAARSIRTMMYLLCRIPCKTYLGIIRVIFCEVFIMCDFNIIVVRNAVREQIMNAVAKIVVDGSSIQLTGIFGETMTIEGTIKEINVSRSEILVIQK